MDDKKLSVEETIEILCALDGIFNFDESEVSGGNIALDESIMLLDKLIPKKPEFIHMLGERTYKAKCPCGRVFIANIDVESNPKYCSGCGQAFDWSE